MAIETRETVSERTLANQAQQDVARGAENFKVQKMKEAKQSKELELAEVAKAAWEERKNVAKTNGNYAPMVLKAARVAVKSGDATPSQVHKIQVEFDNDKKRLGDWQEAAVRVPELKSIQDDEPENWTEDLANELATKKRKLDQRQAGLATGYANSNAKKDAKKLEELKQKGGKVHWGSRLAQEGSQAAAALAKFEAHPERAANVKPLTKVQQSNQKGRATRNTKIDTAKKRVAELVALVSSPNWTPQLAAELQANQEIINKRAAGQATSKRNFRTKRDEQQAAQVEEIRQNGGKLPNWAANHYDACKAALAKYNAKQSA